MPAPAHAAVGINQTINFQGRLLSNTGAVVADGSYNMRFKIYQDGAGTAANNGGSGLKWTELWQNQVASGSTSGVTVKNGYFSVNLGAFCAFTTATCQGNSNVFSDWNQSVLWLSMDVGGTAVTNTPTYDGELLPMRRMASAVYAINAGQLGGLTSGQYVQLAQPIQSAVTSTNAAIGINVTSGSGNFLTLQANGTDAFDVSSTGNLVFGNNADKTVSVAATATANGTASALLLKAGDESSATCGTSCTAGALTLQGGSATGGAGTRIGGNVVVDAGTGAAAASNGQILIGTTNDTVITLGKTTATNTITIGQSTATNTISIGSANPNGTTQTINIGNGSETVAASQITVNILSGAAGSNGAATLNVANNDRVTGVDIGNVVADANRTLNVFTGNTLTGLTDTVNIATGVTAGTGAKAVTIGSITASAGNTALMQGGTGAAAVSLQTASTGTIVIGTTNNSAITTGTGLLTQGGDITFSGTALRTITGPATGGLKVNVTSGPLTLSTTTSGTATLQGAAGVFLSAGTAASVDVIQIGVGGAGSATPDYLALDIKSTTGDPAGGVEGEMYYNTFDNKFRCFQTSAWTDCIGTGGGSGINNQTTLQTAANFYIESNAVGNVTAAVRMLTSQTADLLQFQTPTNGIIAGVRPSGTIYSAPVTTPATDVPANARLFIQPLAAASTAIIARASATGPATGDILQLQDTTGATNLFKVDVNGSATSVGSITAVNGIFADSALSANGDKNLSVTSTANPAGGGTQTGFALQFTNSPTTTLNTAIGQSITLTDSTAIASSIVQGMVIAVTETGNANKTVQGLQIDMSGTTNTNTSAPLTGLLVKAANSSGAGISANLALDLQNSSGQSLFKVANTGATTIAGRNDNGTGGGTTSLTVTGGLPSSNNPGGIAINTTGGAGGAGAGTTAGQPGGDGLRATGGAGGAGTGATFNGGVGGAILLQGGLGGTSALATGGAGGAVNITGGNGNTGSVNGLGGNVTITAGLNGGATVRGTVKTVGDFVANSTLSSATAFQVQDSSSAPLLLANTITRAAGTAGNFIKIGDSTGSDTATTILQLDAAGAAITTNLASLNGGMFYSNTGKISVIEGGAVKVLCNTTDLGCGAGGTGLAKNPAVATGETSSITTLTAGNFGYTFTNNTSAATASGVLKVDNGANTGSTLSVAASANPAAGSALIFAKHTNAAVSGNLLDLQSGVSGSETSKLVVTTAGKVGISTGATAPTTDLAFGSGARSIAVQATAGGNGGDLSVSAGAGGNSVAVVNGGNLNFVAGAAGTGLTPTLVDGGDGGDINFTGGIGQAINNGSQFGGLGGSFFLNGGAGGANANSAGIGGGGGSYTVTGGTGGAGGATTGQGGNGGDLTLQGGSGGTGATQGGGGSISLKPGSGSALGSVIIGQVSTDANAYVLTLDSYNGASEASFIGNQNNNGSMYYNTNLLKFRCRENTVWVNCIGSGGSGLSRTAMDTGSASVTAAGFLYTFTNTNATPSTGGVLKVDNGANTGSSISIATTGNPGAGNALIFAKQTNAAVSGNLIDLQSGASGSETTKFSVSAAGNVNIGPSGAGAGQVVNVLNGLTSGSYTINIGSAGAGVTGSTNIQGGSFGLGLYAGIGTTGTTGGLGGTSQLKGGGGGTGTGGVGGTGGSVAITGGLGGTGSALFAGGIGGNLDLQGGAGGTGGTAGGVGGNILIRGGTGNGGSANGIVQIGSSSTDAQAYLLALDSYNQATDPTNGVAGSMYYNTNLTKYRCFTTTWVDCDTSGGGGGVSLNPTVAGQNTISPSGSGVQGLVVNGNSTAAGYVSALSVSQTYSFTASQTSSAQQITVTDSSNTAGFTTTASGLQINSTVAVAASGAGVHTVNALNVAQPSASVCASTSCVWNGSRVANAAATLTNLTQNAYSVVPSGVSNGLFNGMNFGNITGGTGQENAIFFGTGWDSNLTVTASTAGTTANSLTVKNNLATQRTLMEVRDLTGAAGATSPFGGLVVADGFSAKQSYIGDEFNVSRASCVDSNSAANVNHTQIRGDYGSSFNGGCATLNAGEISTSYTSGFTSTLNSCTYSSVSAPNGFERIIGTTTSNAGSTANCMEYWGANTGGVTNIFNTGNYPQIAMKARVSANSANQRVFLGISNQGAAVSALPNNVKAIYFTNCSNPFTPTCGAATWQGVVQDGGGLNTSFTAVSCTAGADTGTISTSQFAYMRIEVRKSTASTAVEIQFFIDSDVSNGITETSCGTVTSTPAAMGNTAMSMMLAQATTTVSIAAWNLDVDYFRAWQDDAPDAAPSTDLQNSTTLPAAAAYDATSGGDTSENYVVDNPELYAPGDVVSIDEAGGSKMRKSNAAYDRNLAGVVASSSANTLGQMSDKTVRIAMTGRAPVRVSGENGVIKPGDLLTASSVPGVAMKATKDGPVIGQALDGYDGPGANLILVKLGLSNKAGIDANDLQAGAIDQASISTLDVTKNLDVKGDAVFRGQLSVNDLEIAGHVTVGPDTAGTATIPAGQASVKVVFDKPYTAVPVVTTGTSDYVTVRVSDKTIHGFTIGTQKPVTHDTLVDWTALEPKSTPKTGQDP